MIGDEIGDVTRDIMIVCSGTWTRNRVYVQLKKQPAKTLYTAGGIDLQDYLGLYIWLGEDIWGACLME